ncbi:hypothetical protein PE36_10473 [Moritella sp. PE36]|nr:hypothetical protein PE36_10473 [Moritella sp. PE36]
MFTSFIMIEDVLFAVILRLQLSFWKDNNWTLAFWQDILLALLNQHT